MKNNKRLKNVEMEACIIPCTITFVDMELWVMVDMATHSYTPLW